MRPKKWRFTFYLAQPMTGCKYPEVRKTAWKIAKLARKYGARVVSPVLQEKIPKNKKKLYTAHKRNIIKEWQLDKYPRLGMCHALYAVPGNKFSNGVMIERGYTRWYLWRKVYSFVPKSDYFFSITEIEEDGIYHDHEQAIKAMIKDLGTRKKWILWKLNHLLFGIPKFIFKQLKSLWL